MDPCEYAFSQQAMMRRLISFLRQSQSSCSDTQCFNGSPLEGGQLPALSATPDNMMMMTVFCVIVGLFLFMTRPSSIGRNHSDGKPFDRSDPGSSGDDPSQSAH